MDIKFVTPTYKRAHDLRAVDLFGKELILACHEFEADEYAQKFPDNEIMVIPDNKRGNMAKVRNFIKDNIDSKYYIMVDDDVNKFGFMIKGQFYYMNLQEIKHFAENMYQMAESLGTVLWGVNLQSDPKFYREFNPFSFLTPVLGPFSAHISNPLRYDERLSLNEDYDYFVQVCNKYRKILRFNRYFYKCDHMTQKGGCSAYRTLDEEKRQSEIMIKKWGSKIVSYDFDKSINPRIRIPIKGK